MRRVMLVPAICLLLSAPPAPAAKKPARGTWVCPPGVTDHNYCEYRAAKPTKKRAARR